MADRDKRVLLVASGDSRLSANQTCWEIQKQMEQDLEKVIIELGYKLERAHPYKEDEGHAFIASQQEGIAIFAHINKDLPIIVAESVWQYSHHVLVSRLINSVPHSGNLIVGIAYTFKQPWPEVLCR